MTDVSRQHVVLILKGTNTLDQITVFWDVSSCSLLYILSNFGKTYSLPLRKEGHEFSAFYMESDFSSRLYAHTAPHNTAILCRVI